MKLLCKRDYYRHGLSDEALFRKGIIYETIEESGMIKAITELNKPLFVAYTCPNWIVQNDKFNEYFVIYSN